MNDKPQLLTIPGARPADMMLQASYLHLIRLKKIEPGMGFDAAVCAAVNIGVTLCDYDDATKERLYREWLAQARALQLPAAAGIH